MLAKYLINKHFKLNTFWTGLSRFPNQSLFYEISPMFPWLNDTLSVFSVSDQSQIMIKNVCIWVKNHWKWKSSPIIALFGNKLLILTVANYLLGFLNKVCPRVWTDLLTLAKGPLTDSGHLTKFSSSPRQRVYASVWSCTRHWVRAHWKVALTLLSWSWILRVWRSLDWWKLLSFSAAKRWMSEVASRAMRRRR